MQKGVRVTGIHEGYRTKTIRGSNWVAQINRPILTEEERIKAEARLQDALDEFARSYALCAKGSSK